MVSVRRGLLQGGVRDVHLLAGVRGRLEKVGHEEDLRETERKEKLRMELGKESLRNLSGNRYCLGTRERDATLFLSCGH